MDIYALKGTKVKFLNDNGYDHDRKFALEKGLEQGQNYEVQLFICIPCGIQCRVQYRNVFTRRL